LESFNREKKILVTGGAGFIGSNLCEALLKVINTVVCLDNFLTGKKAKYKMNFLNIITFSLLKEIFVIPEIAGKLYKILNMYFIRQLLDPFPAL